ncbi:hypothetical protein JTE90_015752 [Oedothorax gibbosus]|uniref:Uncharacterized protein n=1 Tax=Oedothorax gibbosus TaxID=931172 RepID=A0AAV6TR29_9ARAC|nr:hypothetical protein JTE90_015752 [Oedothorax gibbosus]
MEQWYDFPIKYPADPATDTHGETNPETKTSPTDHQPMRDEQQPSLHDDVTTEEDDSEGEAVAPIRRVAGRPRKEKTSRGKGDQEGYTTTPSWRPPTTPCLHAGAEPCLHHQAAVKS